MESLLMPGALQGLEMGDLGKKEKMEAC